MAHLLSKAIAVIFIIAGHQCTAPTWIGHSIKEMLNAKTFAVKTMVSSTPLTVGAVPTPGNQLAAPSRLLIWQR